MLKSLCENYYYMYFIQQKSDLFFVALCLLDVGESVVATWILLNMRVEYESWIWENS